MLPNKPTQTDGRFAAAADRQRVGKRFLSLIVRYRRL